MVWNEVRKILIEAGINTTEAAMLFGVTRQTLYNWNKGSVPAEDIAKRIAATYWKIEAAIKNDSLPLLFATKDRKKELLNILMPR